MHTQYVLLTKQPQHEITRATMGMPGSTHPPKLQHFTNFLCYSFVGCMRRPPP